jgi:ubiquinone/menaquinone biosynthesis C-methylase UbiE
MRSARVEVKEGGASAIPYPDASFDRVAAVNTLHFWPDPPGGLREALRVLRPGGRLIVILRPKEYLERIRFTTRGFTGYSDAQLRALLVGAGFGEVRIEEREDGGRGMQIALATRPAPGRDAR